MPRSSLLILDRDAVLRVCDYLTGDGIFDTDELIKDGLPSEFVRRHNRIFESSFKDPRKVLCASDGFPVAHLEGVAGLTLLRAICSALHVTWRGHGRLRPVPQGRLLVSLIRRHYGVEPAVS